MIVAQVIEFWDFCYADRACAVVHELRAARQQPITWAFQAGYAVALCVTGACAVQRITRRASVRAVVSVGLVVFVGLLAAQVVASSF